MTKVFTYSAKEAIKPILHAQACVKAVEAIGGDPEMVGNLVKALKMAVEKLPRDSASAIRYILTVLDNVKVTP